MNHTLKCQRRGSVLSVLLRHLVLLPLLWCLGCAEGPAATEVLVLIDAEASLRSMLTRLQVDIYDARGLDSAKQPLQIELGAGPNQHTLPLSFSVAANNEDDQREFRVVVTGYDAQLRVRVEQQVITSFHPRAAGRLDLFLFGGCADLCRVNGQLGAQTCSRTGVCEDVPVLNNLPEASGDELGGYTVVTTGPQEAGVAVLAADAGRAAETGAGSLTPDASQRDASNVTVGPDAGSGLSSDAAVNAPSDAQSAAADADARVSPSDAQTAPSDAKTPVDATNPDATDPDAKVDVDAADPDAGRFWANPIIPAPSTTCPTFLSGSITALGLTAQVYAGSTGAAKGSLLFYWHGTGSSFSELNSMLPAAVRNEIIDGGGMIVSGASSTNTGTDTSGTGIWHAEDFPAIDLIAACAVRDYNIDPRRIYATGASSGAINASVLAFQRASYIAAITANSGGLTSAAQAVLQPGAPRVAPVLTMHGPMGTDVVGVDFATASMTLDTQVKARGGLAIDCDHGGRHAAAPAALQTAAWQFMKDHPYGVTPEPYAALPASFPSYCALK